MNRLRTIVTWEDGAEESRSKFQGQILPPPVAADLQFDQRCADTLVREFVKSAIAPEKADCSPE